jgi:DNA invertase Pin-like site-specific DNA recombinase
MKREAPMATTTPRRDHAGANADRDKRAALQLAVRAAKRADAAAVTKANAVRFALDQGASLRELADALGVSHMTVKRLAGRADDDQ